MKAAFPLLVAVASAILAAGECFAAADKPKIAFDLSHGQFQDKFVDPSYYDYVLPAYREICAELGAEYGEIRGEVTPESLKGVRALIVISPLARSTQRPFGEGEKKAVVDFIRAGGSVAMFVDEEEYRVILSEYGVNDITRPFGIELGDDIEGLPGNCGAVSFENEIFGGRREVPYSGSRKVRGGIPASVCMEGGWAHACYVNQTYPFKRDQPDVMGEPPKDWTSYAARNPVGSYRRDFDVPEKWNGQEIFLKFDAVDSFFYLWVNGEYVGFSKDSRNPAEFNVTRFVKPGGNTVALEVYRYSDGSYLEDQDMFRLSGIARSTWLLARPKMRIRDFTVTPRPVDKNNLNGDWVLEIECKMESVKCKIDVATVAVSLYDADGNEVSMRKDDERVEKAGKDSSTLHFTLYTLHSSTLECGEAVSIHARPEVRRGHPRQAHRPQGAEDRGRGVLRERQAREVQGREPPRDEPRKRTRRHA